MKYRKTLSVNFALHAKGMVGDLARMWQAAPARSRLDAYASVARDLGISERKVKAVIYDEETLPPYQAPVIEAREQGAWAHLEQEFLQLAEYCRAKAELAKAKRIQWEIDFTESEPSCSLGLRRNAA